MQVAPVLSKSAWQLEIECFACSTNLIINEDDVIYSTAYTNHFDVGIIPFAEIIRPRSEAFFKLAKKEALWHVHRMAIQAIYSGTTSAIPDPYSYDEIFTHYFQCPYCKSCVRLQSELIASDITTQARAKYYQHLLSQTHPKRIETLEKPGLWSAITRCKDCDAERNVSSKHLLASYDHAFGGLGCLALCSVCGADIRCVPPKDIEKQVYLQYERKKQFKHNKNLLSIFISIIMSIIGFFISFASEITDINKVVCVVLLLSLFGGILLIIQNTKLILPDPQEHRKRALEQ